MGLLSHAKHAMVAAALLAASVSDLRAQAIVTSAPVDPVIPGLHNTGVGDDDKKLKDGDPDPHFSVTGPVSGTPRVVGANKIPKDWVSRQDSSLWISIASDAIAPEGTYRYEMKFDLTGFDPASVSMSGLWAVDNAGAEIRLNGKSTGIVNTVGPGEYTSFTLNRGFAAGVKSFELFVPNVGSSGGYRSKPDPSDDDSLTTGLRMQLSSVTAPAAKTDLAISKSHDGNFVPGSTGTYRITVKNVGDTTTSAKVTVSDSLPAGLTPTAATGSGWTCSVSGQDVSCTRQDALAPGNTYPVITITVDVAATATSVTNTARVNVSGDDNPSNNVAVDPTTVEILPGPADLSIRKRHDARFRQGGTGAYQIDVQNIGESPTSGIVSVRDTVPNGLIPTSASGTGWSCQVQQVVTCTRSDSLAPGKAYPTITLTVDVSETAGTVVNTATVEGGGDNNNTNNTAEDRTIVLQADRDLAISKSHIGSFRQGETGRTFTVRVSNVGNVPSIGAVTVTDTVPAGLTATSAAGQGWTCSIAGATVTCSRSDLLAAGQAFPDITLTVDVADNASDVVNVVTLQNDADTRDENNSAQDPVAINKLTPIVTPDLTINKFHIGAAVQGSRDFPFRILVRNRGDALAIGGVAVSDALPAGFMPTSASGAGWACAINGSTVTCQRNDLLLAGSAYPFIVIMTDVANDATTTVNEATVSGGNDSDASNNTARDQVLVKAARNPDLTIAKSHSNIFERGQPQSFVIDVRNVGDGQTSGLVTVTDTLPAGLIPAGASGTGWNCGTSGQTVTCSRSDLLLSDNKYPSITLNVNVQASAESSINTATVVGDNEIETGNNA